MPRTPDDENTYQTTQERVRRVPSVKRHERARKDRAERAERIADDMKPDPAHVQIIFMVAVQQPGATQVDDESARCDHDHQSAANFRRRGPTLVSFVENEQ